MSQYSWAEKTEKSATLAFSAASSGMFIDESASVSSSEIEEEDPANSVSTEASTDEGQDSALLNRLFPVIKAYAASDISDLEKSDEKSKELFKGFLYHSHERDGTWPSYW